MNGCESPSRWVLYHWGELRTGMGSWHENLMKATFGELKVEGFGKSKGSSCFEKAVVMRHNIGKMGKERRLEVFDMLRCKARAFCNVRFESSNAENNEKEDTAVRLTLLMRKGARSFKNESLVVKIFSNECARVKVCKLTVTQSENLSFCDQQMAIFYEDDQSIKKIPKPVDYSGGILCFVINASCRVNFTNGKLMKLASLRMQSLLKRQRLAIAKMQKARGREAPMKLFAIIEKDSLTGDNEEGCRD
ncbi:hypothetical protein IFM89_033289 [Coptis chinensis]|uniref:Uncharacterized protein n=1 Tax=Coptis chinensis TaxID=261450 RepID=A0A835HQC9_9MAGN|nr:hypothetical protein IFM89_033289 [Coptis chinensis]